MKTKIDVEKLVQWALREELPKGQAIAASAWDIITQYASLGVRVDTSGPRDGYGFTPGAPHADALIVAAAVQRLETRWRFPTAFDARAAFGDLLPIAGDAVRDLAIADFDPRSLVIAMAMQGRRPSWKFEQPVPQQMFVLYKNERGEVRERPLVQGRDGAGDLVAMMPNRGRAAQRDGVYSYAMAPRSPLNWCDPSLLHIGECRAEWMAWHRALVALAHDLKDKLAAFDVMSPAASALPWSAQTETISRVIEGRDLGEVGEIVPLAPKRRAALPPIESDIERRARVDYSHASRTKVRKAAAVVA